MLLKCCHEAIKVFQLWGIIIVESDHPFCCSSLQCYGHIPHLGPLSDYLQAILLHVGPNLHQKNHNCLGSPLNFMRRPDVLRPLHLAGAVPMDGLAAGWVAGTGARTGVVTAVGPDVTIIVAAEVAMPLLTKTGVN